MIGLLMTFTGVVVLAIAAHFIGKMDPRRMR